MEWWSSLRLAEQFFYGVAVLSTLVLLVQLLLNLIGVGGDDVGVDGGGIPDAAGADLDHPEMEAHSSGLGMLSVKTVLAFMVGFGWTGVLLLGYGFPILVAIPGATLVGFLFMLVVFYLMKGIYGLSDSGNVDEKNAAGKAGTVYLPVAPRRTSAGQVQVVVQGRMREIPCVTDSEEKLPAGTPVRVVKVMDGGIALVERMEAEHE